MQTKSLKRQQENNIDPEIIQDISKRSANDNTQLQLDNKPQRVLFVFSFNDSKEDDCALSKSQAEKLTHHKGKYKYNIKTYNLKNPYSKNKKILSLDLLKLNETTDKIIAEVFIDGHGNANKPSQIISLNESKDVVNTVKMSEISKYIILIAETPNVDLKKVKLATCFAGLSTPLMRMLSMIDTKFEKVVIPIDVSEKKPDAIGMPLTHIISSLPKSIRQHVKQNSTKFSGLIFECEAINGDKNPTTKMNVYTEGTHAAMTLKNILNPDSLHKDQKDFPHKVTLILTQNKQDSNQEIKEEESKKDGTFCTTTSEILRSQQKTRSRGSKEK